MLVFEYRVAVEMKDGNRIPLDCNLVNLHIVVVGPSAGFNHIQLYGFSNSSLYVHAIKQQPLSFMQLTIHSFITSIGETNKGEPPPFQVKKS